MSFERLTRGDWIAWGAALVLLVSLAFDWYGTEFGDDARRIEETAPTSVPEGEQLREDARLAAEGEERTPFQEDGAIDRILLVMLLAAVALAIAAAFLRAAGRSYAPPGTPSGAAAVAGTVGAMLVTYRIIQEPGLDAATTVKFGAVLGLVAAGALALGASTALRAEQDGTAFPAEEEPAAS